MCKTQFAELVNTLHMSEIHAGKHQAIFRAWAKNRVQSQSIKRGNIPNFSFDSQTAI
jgi:hypothetical protein